MENLTLHQQLGKMRAIRFGFIVRNGSVDKYNEDQNNELYNIDCTIMGIEQQISQVDGK